MKRQIRTVSQVATESKSKRTEESEVKAELSDTVEDEDVREANSGRGSYRAVIDEGRTE